MTEKTASEKMVSTGYEPRLRVYYRNTVVPEMMKASGFTSPMAAPRLTKIVVNMGVNDARENAKAIDGAAADLAAVTGQKPQVRRAKKSISNFKLREGMPIGVRVTLRSGRMFEFLDRLVNVAIPRLRDFQGLDPRKGFDGNGNYNLGLTEQYVFPEIQLEKSAVSRGMNVTIVTNAGEDGPARDLLGRLGMPFKKPADAEARKG
jgi:large subunit ribosomal protein L5